jgi:hypothetical protein
MKNQIIILVAILLLFFFGNLNATGPDTLWFRYLYGGAWNYSEGLSLCQTMDGGYMIAGACDFFDSSILIKTDSDGHQIWYRKYGGQGDFGLSSVLQIATGEYVAVGCTASVGSDDVCLAKIDSNGGIIWTRTYGGYARDAGHSLQETSKSGYIIAGITRSFGAGGNDVYLVKTDSLGDTLWTHTYGGTENDAAYSVQETSDSGYITAGFTTSFGAGNEDVYLIKTDSLGDTIWTRTYGGQATDIAFSVQEITTNGEFIITGYTHSFGSGDADIYLLKIDSLGDTVWTSTIGTNGWNNRGYSVQETHDGGFIIGGESSFFTRTNSNGDSLWHAIHAPPSRNYIKSGLQTSDYGYVGTGAHIDYDEWGTPFIYIMLLKTNPFSLVSPNGSEVLLWDEVHNILWFCERYSGISHTYRLLLSIDGGNSYGDTIAESISPDSSSWLWTIPHVYSTTCRMKVQILDSLNNLIDDDQSDADFIIAQTGIEEQKKIHSRDFRVSFFPNPFSTVTTLKLLGVGKNAKHELTIYNSVGRLVKSIKLETNTYQFGADLVPGVYFLKVKTGEYTDTKKLIKIR